MRSEIGYHFLKVPKVSGAQVDGVTLFGAIIITTPFSEVTPLAGVQDVSSWLQRCRFLLGVHRAGYLQPREQVNLSCYHILTDFLMSSPFFVPASKVESTTM